MRLVELMVVCLLAVVSSSARAEWVTDGRTESTTIYFDPATIRKTNNVVKMWRLLNFNPPRDVSGKLGRSLKALHEYDCKEEQLRAHYVAVYSGEMGNGKIISVAPNLGDWRPIPPDSLDESLLQIACGRK